MCQANHLATTNHLIIRGDTWEIHLTISEYVEPQHLLTNQSAYLK